MRLLYTARNGKTSLPPNSGVDHRPVPAAGRLDSGLNRKREGTGVPLS
jgi:hypothetical protein